MLSFSARGRRVASPSYTDGSGFLADGLRMLTAELGEVEDDGPV